MRSRIRIRFYAVAALLVLVTATLIVPGVGASPHGAFESVSAVRALTLGGKIPHIVPIVLSSPDPTDYGQFGTSVAISGTTMIVGAPYETAGGQAAAGHVWIFNLLNGSSTSLTSPNAQQNGDFGYAVAINGTNLVVGAPGEVGLTLPGAGNAYLYNETTGKLVATLTDGHPIANGEFGASVAVGRAFMVVGAPDETASGDSQAGRAYTFNATTGASVKSLASPQAKHLGASGGGEFGYAVAVYGSSVAVGAPYENGTTQSLAGNAYLFNASTGARLASLQSRTPQGYGFFGWSVGLSSTRVAVGAPFETGAGVALAGNAYLFNASTDTWVATLTSPNAQSDGLFGIGLAMGNSTVIVGAPQENADGQTSAGNAYNFSAAGGTLIATYADPEPQYVGGFGSSAAVYGLTVVIGGPEDNVSTTVDAGLAFVYGSLPEAVASGSSLAASGATVVVGVPEATVAGLSDAGEVWLINTTSGTVFLLTSPNEQAGGFFGYSVAVNGTDVAVGAPYETVSSRSEAGNAYLFGANSGSFLRTFTSGNVSVEQNFGYSVAVSDGSVVVGAPYATAPESAGDVGVAYVYKATTGGLITTVTGGFLTFFACAVAISGTTFVVGALLEDEAFVYNAVTGALISTLKTPETAVTGEFGTSVGISGTTVVVGAPYETYDKHKGAGNAYLFNAKNGKRIARFNDTEPSADGHYGDAVGISGTMVVVGAPGESFYGLAYIINTTTLGATELSNPGGSQGFSFGQAVAVSGATVVVSSTSQTDVY